MVVVLVGRDVRKDASSRVLGEETRRKIVLVESNSKPRAGTSCRVSDIKESLRMRMKKKHCQKR